ncbi:hypothetical protein SAMN05442782_0326 [Streptomyces sp. OK228]|jgi:beta-phosphoglucomutase-like phosphatase (HAD superfamily)|nr:hypothetical protein SAMN05442782_0326 [Streptomyces sp. OK228]
MTTKRAAIVDVDGTVVDSNYLHVVTWWEAFRQAGRHDPCGRSTGPWASAAAT